MATADPVYDPALTGGGVTLTQGTLAGRGAASGTGPEEAITLGTNLSLSGTTLNANAGSGAPSGAQYLTLAVDAGLSAERVATATARVTITDAGANGAATFDLGTASVADSYLADMAARTIKGRAANSTGVPASIAGAGAGTYVNDNATSVAFRAMTDIIQNLNLSGDISPAQITADQNDYNPASLSTAAILRLDLDTPHSITGIAGGADGRVLGVFNTSAVTCTLPDAALGSTAVNRFDFGSDLAIGSKHGALLWYDSTSTRWRLLSRAFPFTPAAASITLTAGAGLTGGGDLSASRSFAVGAGDSSITVNADDIIVATNGITTAKILDANVTYAKIQSVGALAVVGRSANTSGVAADIAASAASGAVLREAGSVLGFGTVGAAGIASDAVTTIKILDANVTYAKIANATARSLLGRSANSTGVLADISGAGAGTYAHDNGTSIAFRRILPREVTLTDAATITVDASLIGQGDAFTVTLGGNRTLGAPTNPTAGQWMTVVVRQDATGSRTLAYTSGAGGYRFTTTVTSPTLTTGVNKFDYLLFRYNTTDDRWDAMAVNLSA